MSKCLECGENLKILSDEIVCPKTMELFHILNKVDLVPLSHVSITNIYCDFLFTLNDQTYNLYHTKKNIIEIYKRDSVYNCLTPFYKDEVKFKKFSGTNLDSYILWYKNFCERVISLQLLV